SARTRRATYAATAERSSAIASDTAGGSLLGVGRAAGVGREAAGRGRRGVARLGVLEHHEDLPAVAVGIDDPDLVLHGEAAGDALLAHGGEAGGAHAAVGGDDRLG